MALTDQISVGALVSYYGNIGIIIELNSSLEEPRSEARVRWARWELDPLGEDWMYTEDDDFLVQLPSQ